MSKAFQTETMKETKKIKSNQEPGIDGVIELSMGVLQLLLSEAGSVGRISSGQDAVGVAWQRPLVLVHLNNQALRIKKREKKKSGKDHRS